VPVKGAQFERVPTSESKNAPGNEVPYYVKASALGIPAYLIGVHLWTWVFNVRYFLAGRADFRALYTAGYLLRTGGRHQLYDYALQEHLQNAIVGLSNTPLPFNHLAYESLLFAPLSLLKYRTAYLIFLLANLLTLAACIRMLQPWTRNLARVYAGFPLALFAAYLPIAAALIQGQDSILLLAAVCGLLVLLERNEDRAAGALLGLTMFKFQFALPIVLIFLAWRRWKFVSGFVLCSLSVLLVSVWLVGIAETRQLFHLLSTISATSGPADYLGSAVNPIHMPNLRGLVFGIGHNYFSVPLLQSITAALSAALLLWVARMRVVSQSRSGLMVAVTAAVLVSYHSNIHDLSILLGPILWTLDRHLLHEADHRTSRWLVVSATLAFCAPVAESFFPDHLYLASIPIIMFLVVLAKYDASSAHLTGVPLTSDTSVAYSPVL